MGESEAGRMLIAPTVVNQKKQRLERELRRLATETVKPNTDPVPVPVEKTEGLLAFGAEK